MKSCVFSYSKPWRTKYPAMIEAGMPRASNEPSVAIPGAATVTLLTAQPAVGKHSEPEPRYEVCHEGKKLKVHESELDEHLGHGDALGKCPKPKKAG